MLTEQYERQRPECVHRLALINSLATYHLDHWRKWLEARVPALLVPLIGMERMARLVAGRLFPKPWQRILRERAAAVVSAVPTSTYLGMGLALQQWSAIDRLDGVSSKTLVIAAENDYTPLAEKREMAERLRADLVVVRGSRHGTPFDSVAVTNARELAQTQITREAEEIEQTPLAEQHELALIFQAKGMPKEDAQRVAEGLSVQSLGTGGYCRARPVAAGDDRRSDARDGALAQCPSAAWLARSNRAQSSQKTAQILPLAQNAQGNSASQDT